MKVIIPGGSGQVGTLLARSFHADGHEVVVLGRGPRAAPWRTVGWDAATVGAWAAECDGADAIINLAGRSVNCRYTPANRRAILDSRIDSTRVVGAAIGRVKRPPRVWLQASTATIYAHTFGTPHDEARGVLGGAEPGVPETWRFSVEVARAWERAFDESTTPGTRKVALRSAIIMNPDRGSAFDLLLTLVRRGLGGRSGSGQQYVSWIHERDFVRAIAWLIARDDLDGPINLSAPGPLPNAAFMRGLRAAWGTPFGLPATEQMLEIGALLLRTESELVLKSRRVVPGRLLAEGFAFDYPTWPAAARDLCARWRAQRRGVSA